jgi:hypothetical protein
VTFAPISGEEGLGHTWRQDTRACLFASRYAPNSSSSSEPGASLFSRLDIRSRAAFVSACCVVVAQQYSSVPIWKHAAGILCSSFRRHSVFMFRDRSLHKSHADLPVYQAFDKATRESHLHKASGRNANNVKPESPKQLRCCKPGDAVSIEEFQHLYQVCT